MTTPQRFMHTDNTLAQRKARQQTERELRRIENDPTLSHAGKKIIMDEVRAKAKTARDERLAAEMAELNATLAALHRKVHGFTNPTPAESQRIREANDIADTLPSAKDALARLQRAEFQGDRILAKVIAVSCVDRASDVTPEWQAVADHWYASQPHLAEDLADIHSLTIELNPDGKQDSVHSGAMFARQQDFSIGELRPLRREETPQPQQEAG